MNKKEIVLIVDDNESSASFLKKVVEPMVDEEVVVASSGQEAKDIINERELSLAILDYKLPDINGIELLKLIKSKDLDVPVIVVTGFGSIEVGIEAIKQGAYDYLLKPVHPEKIHALVRSLFEYRRLKEENEALREELGLKYTMGQLIGKSPKIRKIYDLLPHLVETDSTILIQGESGTGKELLARAIHYNSSRKDKPFIVADCTALTESLIESELFGHEKGSFTGAIKRKIGRFEQADGGTIFLDEIGDISPIAQLKFLRVLQEKNFERVGGEETIEVDVRVIAATNKNLEKVMGEGKFREDLYYRLNVIPIFMPPLRERKEDIAVLAKEYMNIFAKKNNKNIRDIDAEAYRFLVDYEWPGNVRELENAIERAVVIAKGNIIKQEDLPPKIRNPKESSPGKDSSLYGNEKSLIIKILSACNNNIYKTAKELGISRSTLYGKLKKYDIQAK